MGREEGGGKYRRRKSKENIKGGREERQETRKDGRKERKRR